MIKYRVVDLSRDGVRFSLQDQAGLLHVAHVDGKTPLLDEILLGQEAQLGVHLLVSSETHQPMRAEFEAVACTQLQALALLHPATAPGAAP